MSTVWQGEHRVQGGTWHRVAPDQQGMRSGRASWRKCRLRWALDVSRGWPRREVLQAGVGLGRKWGWIYVSFCDHQVEGARRNPTVPLLFHFMCIFSTGKTFSPFKIQKAQDSTQCEFPAHPSSQFPSQRQTCRFLMKLCGPPGDGLHISAAAHRRAHTPSAPNRSVLHTACTPLFSI